MRYIMIMVKVTIKEAALLKEPLSRDQLYVTVDVLILMILDGRLNLLLSRRTDPPYMGRWALPGSFVGTDESAEETAQKLLGRMLPVKDVFLEQLYTFTEVDRDPRGRVISTAYLGIVPPGQLETILKERTTTFHRFEVVKKGGLVLTGEDGETLTGGELAFDHGRIIETGVLRLRGKIDYTDVGFRFLNDPGAFSLSELQTVFEAVLGRPLDSSNFRRFIRSRYEETGRIVSTEREEKPKRGRPAALYQLKEKRGE